MIKVNLFLYGVDNALVLFGTKECESLDAARRFVILYNEQHNLKMKNRSVAKIADVFAEVKDE